MIISGSVLENLTEETGSINEFNKKKQQRTEQQQIETKKVTDNSFNDSNFFNNNSKFLFVIKDRKICHLSQEKQ